MVYVNDLAAYPFPKIERRVKWDTLRKRRRRFRLQMVPSGPVYYLFSWFVASKTLPVHYLFLVLTPRQTSSTDQLMGHSYLKIKLSIYNPSTCTCTYQLSIAQTSIGLSFIRVRLIPVTGEWGCTEPGRYWGGWAPHWVLQLQTVAVGTVIFDRRKRMFHQ